MLANGHSSDVEFKASAPPTCGTVCLKAVSVVEGKTSPVVLFHDVSGEACGLRQKQLKLFVYLSIRRVNNLE